MRGKEESIEEDRGGDVNSGKEEGRKRGGDVNSGREDSRRRVQMYRSE